MARNGAVRPPEGIFANMRSKFLQMFETAPRAVVTGLRWLAIRLAWECSYSDQASDGTYLTPRTSDMFTPEEWAVISKWADGLFDKNLPMRVHGEPVVDAALGTK